MGTETLKGACLCGAVTWTFEGMPDQATICNCSACRRYGAMWIYDFEGERVSVEGTVTAFQRKDLVGETPYLDNRFCSTCGNLVCWRGLGLTEEGKRRMAVNLRLVTEPERVAHLRVRRCNGADGSFEDRGDGRCVSDFWA